MTALHNLGLHLNAKREKVFIAFVVFPEGYTAGKTADYLVLSV